jgi:hypothetical protein
MSVFDLHGVETKSLLQQKVTLFARFDSSAPLLKIVECCRYLESLVFVDPGGELALEKSDILAIASLPRLRSLTTVCGVASEAFSALPRCRGLKNIALSSLVDPAVLTAIGRNLTNMTLWRASKEVADGIAENCPNLKILEFVDVGVDEEEMALMVGSIKSGLKKLTKFKINEESIRLGTDWEGY